MSDQKITRAGADEQRLRVSMLKQEGAALPTHFSSWIFPENILAIHIFNKEREIIATTQIVGGNRHFFITHICKS